MAGGGVRGLEGAGVHEEVDVALAVAELGVGEAVVLVGQGEQGLGEEGELADVDGELAGAGAEEVADDADVVAEVEELVEGEGVFADVVLADVDLHALARLLELGEAGLALDADGHDASGDADGDGRGRGLELFGGEGVEGGAELGDGVAGGVGVGVGGLGLVEAGFLSEGGDLLQLVAAEGVEVLLKLGLEHGFSFWLMSLRFQYSGRGDCGQARRIADETATLTRFSPIAPIGQPLGGLDAAGFVLSGLDLCDPRACRRDVMVGLWRMMGRGTRRVKALGELVKAESMIQLAIALPAGCVIGWLIGAWLDRHFHQNWMGIVGILLGAVAGFMQIFVTASRYLEEGPLMQGDGEL